MHDGKLCTRIAEINAQTMHDGKYQQVKPLMKENITQFMMEHIEPNLNINTCSASWEISLKLTLIEKNTKS